MARARRLTAIVFTDVVGFTALTQRDERRALRLLEEHNRRIRAIVPLHRGKEVKTIGDSFLLEFPSAVDATECAVEIQRAMREASGPPAPDGGLTVRIGIHLGDVVRQRGDVLGDAVNVASRIVPLAEPGGICVSAPVYALVRHKVSNPFAPVSPPEPKEGEAPVEVYRMVLPWEVSSPRAPPSGPDAGAPRIAVLPFTNMSPDPQDEYFADGLTEEITTRLSQVPGLRVVARTSVMPFKTNPRPVAEIGAALRVGALLEGSVRKAGTKLRITAQLVDARSEEHLWAGAFDRQFTDIFEVQREIAGEVAAALHVALPSTSRSSRVPTSNLEAFREYVLGRSLWNRRTPDALRSALHHFEEALRLDPAYAEACSGLADCYSILTHRDQFRMREGLPTARAAAERALELNPVLPEAHASRGLAAAMDFDWTTAESEYRRAIELNPMCASARFWSYILYTDLGRDEDAVRELRRGEEADPLSSQIALHRGILAWRQGRLDEALAQWDRSAELGGEPDFLAAFSVAVLVESGRPAEANDRLARADRDPSHRWGAALRVVALAALGRTEEARHDLAQLERQAATAYLPNGRLAVACGALGDAAGFYDRLARYEVEKGMDPYWVVALPPLKEVRDDPRFEQFRKRTGLAK